MPYATATFNSIADLNLWFKVQRNDAFTYADIPAIISLRWKYLRDNWEFIKTDVEDRIDFYAEPDALRLQIEDFTSFVNSQKYSKNNPFERSNIITQYHAIFNSLLIDNINTSKAEQDLIDEEVARVAAFTRSNFEAIRTALITARDEQADLVDGADDDYNAIYSRSSIPAQIDPTIEIIDNMWTVQQTIIAVEFLLANSFSLKTVKIDPFALARQNANNPEFDITTYNSGRLVRFNYGEDLKQLAKRYFGDPDQWLEIAIANGLKAPYIDEVGMKVPLISNASGNQINVAQEDSEGNLNKNRLFIGQLVFLQSNTELFPEQRIIIIYSY